MNWTVNLIGGLAYGGLLFIIASGLTMTIGLMRRINLSHGAIFLIGGYIAFDVYQITQNYWIGFIAGIGVAAVVGAVIEWGLLQRIADNDIAQIVLTVGVGFVIQDQLQAIYGANPQLPPAPPGLGGQLQLGDIVVPMFAVATIVMAIVLAGMLILLLRHTSIGVKVRASVDDIDIARSVGVRVSWVYVLVFALGSALAGFSGVWGGAYMSLQPAFGWDVLLLGLVVAVIGGLNSILGGLIAGFLIGVLQQFGQAYFPDLASFIMYGAVVVVLLVRPTGLLGKEIAST